MEKANRSKRKVVEANCSKNMDYCSKRKVVEAICSKNMEMEANAARTWFCYSTTARTRWRTPTAQGSGGQLPKNMDK